ncbi:MAG: PEP-CTERM sorting domain-containing protein [Burkholderiaceae bacterium]
MPAPTAPISPPASKAARAARALAAAAALFALAPGAHAAFVTVEFTGFHQGSASVPIVYKSASSSVTAGELNLKIDSLPFTSFCVDLDQHIGWATYSNTYTLDDASLYFNGNQLDEFARLFSSHLTDVNGPQGSAINSAAFQVAVWEITYDGAGGLGALNLGAGNFRDTDLAPGTAGAVASGWLAGLGNQSPGAWKFQVLHSPSYQDQLIANVPGPATLPLLAASLVGWGIARRRRR